ncbi:MAG: glucosaminidase domain-containing protein [Bacillota bacterium]
MSRIIVKPQLLKMLSSQLQRVAGDVQAIEARLSRVMAGLDWEVRSRAGVENQWYNARSLARSTAQCAEAMARFLIYKAQAFEDADRQGEGVVGQTGTAFVAAIREWVQSPFGKTNSFSWQKIDDINKLGLLGTVGLAFPAIGIFSLPAVGAGILNAVVPGLRPPGPTAPGPTPPPSPSGPAGGDTGAVATPPGTGTTPPVGGGTAIQGTGNPLSLDDAIRGVSGNQTVIQGQGYLTVMGFPIGTSGPNGNGVDAKWGNMSKASTKLFQQMMGLPQTGELDATTLVKMKECAGSGLTLKQLAKNAFNSGIRPEIAKGSTQAERVNAIYFYALIDEDTSGVPAAITVAQAIQESNAGSSIPTDKNNGTYSYNMFGIKADKRWLNKGGAYVVSNTWEHINGQDIRVDVKFRAYGSYLESVSDHSQFLRDNSTYSSLFSMKKDENYLSNWARGLQNAGYATDPNYANQLIRHINAYGLK